MEARESSRQETAERLRDKYRERNTPGVLVAQDVGMQAYDCLKDLESCLPDGDSMFTVLADLIDPTCHPVPPDGGSFTCSECGERIGTVLPALGTVLSHHCSHCGARMVDWGDA